MRSVRAIAMTAAAVVGTPAGVAAQVGAVSFANSGAAEAQSVFNHGVAQLHNFQYAEAGADFREAQRIDPGFVMAYWGEAMTYNHPIWLDQDSVAARAVLTRLGATRERRLELAATERERAYLEAVETLYGAGAKEARDFAYSEAMRRVYQAYRDDPDAAAFYALSILGTAHNGRDVATYIRAASVVERVFDEHPNHPGAVHYLIHSYDDPVHAPLGLRAAQAYSKIAPDAAHAQHMTSHIFVAMGMWKPVVTANENARRVARAAAEARGGEPRGCGHYNYWLEYGYLQQGRIEDAGDLLLECYVTASGPVERGSGDILDVDATTRGSYAAMLARYILDTEAWDDESLRWTLPLDDLFPARLTWTFVNGYAAAMRGELVTTEVSREAISGARRELEGYLRGGPSGGDANLGPAYSTRAHILELQLEALLLAARGQTASGLDVVRQAVDLENGLPQFFGPPFVEKPSRELEGEMRLASGDYAGAATAFRDQLARTPERVASARGLDRALAARVTVVESASEESKVLAVVQAFFDAMAAGDSAAAAATLTDGAALVGTTETPDGIDTNEMRGVDFLGSIASSGSTLLERMWDPTVMIRGAMAVVWTPYDFHRDGEFSHCGIDAVSLVRTNAGWRIASLVWTVERTGCTPSPLGPPGR